MVLPDTVFWGGLGAVITWLLKIETQMMARPTRAELERHLEKIQKASEKSTETAVKPMQGQLEKIERMLETSSQQRTLHNDLVGSTLTNIRMDIAILKTRYGLENGHDKGNAPP